MIMKPKEICCNKLSFQSVGHTVSEEVIIFGKRSPAFILEFLANDYSARRSSHTEVFCKKGFLEKFAKFIGKHLY